MGSKTVVTLFDDLDGSTEDIRTVSLALDGQSVELDLSHVSYVCTANSLDGIPASLIDPFRAGGAYNVNASFRTEVAAPALVERQGRRGRSLCG